MEPWGTPALTGYCCEDFPSRTTQSRLLLRKDEIRPNLTRNFIGLKFVKKTSMPNLNKSIRYIKCYSLSSARPIKTHRNSNKYNCRKICSSSRRRKTIFEIIEKAMLLWVINKPIIHKFFKEFTNHWKKTNSAVVSNNLENKIPSNTYWRVQLACMKTQAHISSEPPHE